MTDNLIGVTTFVAQALPATNDDTGFEALTWVQVKGMQTSFVLGVSHSNIDIPDLGTGFTSAAKGAASGRDTQATFRYIEDDPGQIDVIEQAVDPDGVGAVKLVWGSGSDTGDGPAPVSGDKVHYAQGYFHSYEPNQASVDAFEGGTVSFRQNDFTVESTEPA
jgi:hypothetical protein